MASAPTASVGHEDSAMKKQKMNKTISPPREQGDQKNDSICSDDRADQKSTNSIYDPQDSASEPHSRSGNSFLNGDYMNTVSGGVSIQDEVTSAELSEEVDALLKACRGLIRSDLRRSMSAQKESMYASSAILSLAMTPYWSL